MYNRKRRTTGFKISFTINVAERKKQAFNFEKI